MRMLAPGVENGKQTRQVKRPTTSKELQITQLVEGVGIEDEVFEIYGPTRTAGSIVWDLWVYDKDVVERMEVRFGFAPVRQQR